MTRERKRLRLKNVRRIKRRNEKRKEGRRGMARESDMKNFEEEKTTEKW